MVNDFIILTVLLNKGCDISLANHPKELKDMQISSIKQYAYSCTGWTSFSLGMAGIVIPILPTTLLWMLATWCWAKGNSPMTQKMLNHPKLGKSLRLFIEYGVIEFKIKLLILIGLASSYLSFLWFGPPILWLAASSGILMSVIAIWILLRPQTPAEEAEVDVLPEPLLYKIG